MAGRRLGQLRTGNAGWWRGGRGQSVVAGAFPPGGRVHRWRPSGEHSEWVCAVAGLVLDRWVGRGSRLGGRGGDERWGWLGWVPASGSGSGPRGRVRRDDPPFRRLRRPPDAPRRALASWLAILATVRSCDHRRGPLVAVRPPVIIAGFSRLPP